VPRAFHFAIITREGPEYDGQIVLARLCAPDGYFGVMGDHAPLLAILVPGDLIVTEGAGKTRLVFAAGAGVVEVRDNEVTAVLETAELATEIDVVRAQAAAGRARARLAKTRTRKVDVTRAESALHRALARLHAAGELPGPGGSD